MNHLYRSLFIPISIGTVLGTQLGYQLPAMPNAIQAYRIASPAFVTIDAGGGMGSGAVIHPSGLVITNAHVVGGAGSVGLTWLNNRRARGQVIAKNNQADLALIRISGASNLPSLKINTVTPPVGEEVYAIGSPFGEFKGSLTRGVVSRVTRQSIQSDAAINSGNSGGPLVNSRGELVGVNASIYTGSSKDEGFVGLSFSVSVNELQRFLQANNTQAQLVNTPTSPIQASPAIASSGAPSITPQVNTQPQPAQPSRVSFNGVLANGDRQAGGRFYDLYNIQARQGQTLNFQMGSPTFWGKLGVMDSNGQMLTVNGDGKSNPNVSVTIPANGSYFIVASSATPGAIGSYRVIGGAVQTVSYRQTSFKINNFSINFMDYLGPVQGLYQWLLGLFSRSQRV